MKKGLKGFLREAFRRFRKVLIEVDISNKKYWIYVKIPRTGSTSFVHYTKKFNVDFKKGKYPEKRIIVVPGLKQIYDDNREILEDAFVFSSIRNPYAKFVSGVKHRLPKVPITDVLKDPPKWPDVYEWPYNPIPTPQKLRREVSVYNHVMCPQTRYLMAGDKIRCDYYIRMETYQEDVDRLIGILEINPSEQKLPKLARSQKKRDLTEEEKLRVNELFSDDFDNLGYEMFKQK